MNRDQNIAWNRKRVTIPIRRMAGMLAEASLGAGLPVLGADPLAASELAGMLIGADGDEVYELWMLPWDLDRNYPLRFRLVFTHSSTDADEPAWQVDYKAIGRQDSISDAKSSPDETLTFPATAVSTNANSFEVLDWVESTSDTKITQTDLALLLGITCTTMAASLDEICAYAIEIEYTVGACINSLHRDTTRSAPVTP